MPLSWNNPSWGFDVPHIAFNMFHCCLETTKDVGWDKVGRGSSGGGYGVGGALPYVKMWEKTYNGGKFCCCLNKHCWRYMKKKEAKEGEGRGEREQILALNAESKLSGASETLFVLFGLGLLERVVWWWKSYTHSKQAHSTFYPAVLESVFKHSTSVHMNGCLLHLWARPLSWVCVCVLHVYMRVREKLGIILRSPCWLCSQIAAPHQTWQYTYQ